jgi:hypothetical protein
MFFETNHRDIIHEEGNYFLSVTEYLPVVETTKKCTDYMELTDMFQNGMSFSNRACARFVAVGDTSPCLSGGILVQCYKRFLSQTKYK